MPFEFDRGAQGKKKYGDEQLRYLSPELYRRKLADITRKINTALIKAQKEFKTQFKADYDIKGVGVYGGWARGNPHEGSDLDIFTISARDPADLRQDFEERLRRAHVDTPIHRFGNIVYTNPVQAREFLTDAIFHDGIIIVTPYPAVAAAVNALRG